ncbi:NepR family anti-sigma factor [Mesorhizobium sp. SB112]|uniref:NepR family anti-sigma factor n=1 Tax=Mesorhizobium sp. SB112 TaxID=3151853 RepID=UPI0032635BDD
MTMKKPNSGDASARQTGNALGANSEIGRKLKQYYDELVSDDVPDRFAQLLSQLEQAEPAQNKD